MDTLIDIDMDDEAFETGNSLVRWKDREEQVLNLCKALWPSALDCDVHMRIMGSYNETIPVTITPSASEQPLEIIIRLPSQLSFGETPVFDQVTILHYVRTSTPVRVPDIIAYDTTSDNALESPYLIMERLRGQDLDELLDDMTAEQRKVIALELAELYHQLRQIRSPYSGRIVASEACHLPTLLPSETLTQIPIAMEPYAARVLYTDDDWKARLPTEGAFGDIPEEFVTSGGLLSDPPNLPLLEMATRPFNRRIIQYKTTLKNADDYTASRTKFLRDMMDVIVDEEHVENPSDNFQLVHVDLFPRNIMVDPSSTPMITGIIDWDEAVFAPGFVADVAPAWLWEPPLPEDDEEEEEEEEGNKKPFIDLDKETFERSTQTPPTPELQEVKRVWEKAVGRDCVESATNPYAILARRFLKFASEWQWPHWMHDLYDETVIEFNKLRDEEEAKYLASQEAEDQTEDMDVEIPEDDDDSAWETCSEEDEEDADEDDSEPGSDDIPEYDGDSAWETCSEDEGEDD